MNIRLILLVILVLIFTISAIYVNVISFESTSLEDTYSKGDVEIIQNTTAGTIPHMILVKNNGKKPLMVETGQILESNTSQDLVVAESKRVNQNSSSFIRAYCFQPNQSATPGAKLVPTDKASSEIKQLIENSNQADSQNITRTQLQIWIIVTKDNINTKSGEASVLLEKQEINGTEITKQLNEARNSLIEGLNITEGDIKNIKSNSSIGLNDILDWINGLINWIKKSFNIT